MKINDFGEKIGGAKKDLWKLRNLIYDDILSMNDKEKATYVKKDNIWKKPNYEELVKNGVPVEIAYFIKTVRDSLPQKIYATSIDSEQQYKTYITFIENIRDHTMQIKTRTEAESFYKDHILNKYVTPTYGRFVTVLPEYKQLITNKVLRAVSSINWSRLEADIYKKEFCFSEEEKLMKGYQIIRFDPNYMKFEKRSDYDRVTMMIQRGRGTLYYYPLGEFAKEENWTPNSFFLLYNRTFIANNLDTEEQAKELALSLARSKQEKVTPTKKKKTKFVPKQLENVFRTGANYRRGRNVTGKDYLDKFQFRGGEFGNWLNDKDRQYSLNYGYDAFMDLGKALNIDPKDISLGGNLAIAFGARGSGNAMAHYEPLATVINLTKMKGAGSLAHEWGHALDDYIGKKLSLTGIDTYASKNSPLIDDKLPSMDKLVQAMKYIPLENNRFKRTEFFQNSIAFDKAFSKTDHGYWQSDVEMFARCFACYVYDKLGYQSDYLAGHANSAVATIGSPTGETELIKAYPEGREREEINRCFDELILELKEKEYLHDYDYQKEIEEPIFSKTEAKEVADLSVDEDGQFCLFDLEEEREY